MARAALGWGDGKTDRRATEGPQWFGSERGIQPRRQAHRVGVLIRCGYGTGQTGKPIGELLKGDFTGAMSVAFSPDGMRIVSGSNDSTLRLWDGETGKPIGEPLKGHTKSVKSVAFSPDGKRSCQGVMITQCGYGTGQQENRWRAAERA